MMSKRGAVVAYGFLFNAVLPASLVAWAYGAAGHVALAITARPRLGVVTALVGAVCTVAGMVTLTRHGAGLPMNPFPPKRLVTRGVFAVLGHPIYTGSVVACAGVSLAFGSASGLFLVTPVAALAAAALWFGYERLDLRSRLGERPPPLLALPRGGDAPPTWTERIVATGIFATALGASLAVLAPSDLAPLMTVSHARAGAPIAVWVAGACVMLGSAGLARSRDQLRQSLLDHLALCATLLLVYLALPGAAAGGRLAVPADVVAVVAVLAALPLTPRGGWLRVAISVLGVWALAASGAAGLDAVALGAVVGLAARAREFVWRGCLRASEWVANSWREIRIGPLRLFNHGLLAALPCGAGLGYVGWLLGPAFAPAILAAGLTGIVAAALWAQLIEGSPALSRPYGFFGGLLGIVGFCVLVGPLVFDAPAWPMLAAFCVAGPWIQGLGRIRCLANGCCHGQRCSPAHGIRYHNPHTRVVRLAKLGGESIYPTQLYSLLGNAVLGIVLMRQWAEGVSLPLIAGVYCIGMGLVRFVEEGYRGEPQTPIRAGLRIYQWIAVVSVLSGAILTTLPASEQACAPQWSGAVVWLAAVFTAVVWLAASVDFPESRRRFARLA